MARTQTLICDLCEQPVEIIAAKVYLAPFAPRTTMTSFMSAYSHHGDVCSNCMNELMEKLNKRQARNGNGKIRGKRKTSR